MKMKKKDVFISIKGIQKMESDSDTTELFTKGTLYNKDNCTYISYEESEATGFEGCRTTLKIDGTRKVVMLRSGKSRAQLIMENGRRNIGYYGTPQGELAVGVSTTDISGGVGEHGGDLYCRYTLDINASLMSENELYMHIKEC